MKKADWPVRIALILTLIVTCVVCYYAYHTITAWYEHKQDDHMRYYYDNPARGR